MRESFSYLKKDRIVKRSFFGSSLLLVIAFLYTLLLYGKLPPMIPVFNQLPWGFDRLGDKVTLFLPILLAGVMIFVNIVFSQYIYRSMPLIVRMISITTLFVCIATCIFILRTTLLVL